MVPALLPSETRRRPVAAARRHHHHDAASTTRRNSRPPSSTPGQPFEPTSGKELSLAIEYAGGPFGGDNYFLRPEIGYLAFVPVSNCPVGPVFAVDAEGGWCSRWATDRSTPRALLPRRRAQPPRPWLPLDLAARQGRQPVHDLNEVILGGNSYAQFGVEYHFVLGGPFRCSSSPTPATSSAKARLRVATRADRRRGAAGLRAGIPRAAALHLCQEPDASAPGRFESFQFGVGTSF